MLKTLSNGLKDLIYPPHCLSCSIPLKHHTPQKKLCQPCHDSIEFNHPPFCPKCSRYLGPLSERVRCKPCSANNPDFNFAWGACIYNKHLRNLLHIFKYQQKTSLRHVFAQSMINFIQRHNFDIAQFDIIIPIPLSWARKRERGYNQAGLLANPISKTFNIPISHKILKRNRYTESQTHLSQKERWTNITDAFTIKNSSDVKGKNILLIDDLLTTGATTSEAARTLKHSGAQTVGLLTLAITV
ncbi:Competence protein F homolog, phosphoribosyltransferase domain; protein YhgH required for utilization of DNA as sole source of carbon and energy [hydrothermal vent metagenome]|uniref:Competence protein F homolog, phosphoribosyltransferase domain protein YhgH required for utilization of DNA as sole source of carbon and energy n=1 Tax=hydrothermal vent metagenome TaxID=652676 RepID=A0A3B1DIK0_9ZZZZ